MSVLTSDDDTRAGARFSVGSESSLSVGLTAGRGVWLGGACCDLQRAAVKGTIMPAGSRGVRRLGRRGWVLAAVAGLVLGLLPADSGGAIAPPPGTTKQPTKRAPVPPDQLIGLKSPKRPDPKLLPVGAPVPLGPSGPAKPLGVGNPDPMHQIGPVAVNLASGNVVYETSTPAVATVGGSMGVTFSYNSLDFSGLGLTASYSNDANQNGNFDTSDPLVLRRTDGVPGVSGSPAPSVPTDWWLGRWSGWLIAPASGSWTWSGTFTGGMRITINSTLVYNGWTTASPTPTPITLTQGQAVPIVIDYRKPTGTASMTLSASLAGTGYTIDPSWFSPSARVLPVGWGLSGDSADGLRWRSASVLSGSIVLTDLDGTAYTYTRASGSDPRTGWVPPAGEDDYLALSADGTLIDQSSDGLTYVFAPDGTLSAVTTQIDDRNPAAATRTYATGTDTTAAPRLRTMTDPVSNRAITLSYNQAGLFPSGQTACPTTTATGFDTAPPAGMLCQIDFPDGTATKLFYVAGQLGRVQNPGSAITDLAYGGGLLTKIRDPFVTDVIAAGTNGGGYPDDDTTRVVITYDSATSKATKVALPIEQYWSNQPYQTITYTSSTETKVQVYALNDLTNPADVFRDVTFDTNGRLLTDTNANGNTTSYTWDNADNPLRARAAGRNTTTFYDVEGRATDTYGPGPDSCFDLNTASSTYLKPNGTCTSPPVGHTHTDYDGGIQGLSVAFWPNSSYLGSPTVHSTGTAGTASLGVNWGTSAPAAGIPASAFSARFTGEINLPISAAYTFTLTGSGGASLWIDDAFQVASSGNTPTAVTTPALTAGAHRIRIDATNTTGAASMTLQWTYPGQTITTIPGTAVKPCYGLVI